MNLAVQDAVAAANILSAALVNANVPDDLLAAVQTRRMWPTLVTQRLPDHDPESFDRAGAGGQGQGGDAARVAHRAQRAVLRGRPPAGVIGVGVRPEHIAPALRPA